jgi:hypothetical protein
MTTTAQPQPPAPAADAARLGDFFERVRAANPFLANRVDRPLTADVVDVTGIHEPQFQKLVALGRQARQENRGIGAVVWGEAGVGKSHLLARLGRWYQAREPACFVYLHNLQAGPEHLPRYLLKCVLSVLTRGLVPPLHRTPLYGLVGAALRGVLGRPGETVRASWAQVEAAHARLVNELAARDPSQGVLFDRAVHDVLFTFYYWAHPSHRGRGEHEAVLAARWLSGEPLDAPQAARLAPRSGHGPGGLTALRDNQHVKQVLVALTQLALSQQQLFLLCFDQMDNLDEDQVKALTRFVHDLLDSAGNLLVVTTGVRQTLLGFLNRGVITETSWDRLGQFEISLTRLRRHEGRAILEARLDKFLEPFRAVGPVAARAAQDGLFPLGSAWFADRLGTLPDFRPRDLLSWASDRWQQQQDVLAVRGGPAWLEGWPGEHFVPPPPPPPSAEDERESIDRAVERKLAEQRAQRQREPYTLPPSEDNLARLVYALLAQCLNRPDSGGLEEVQHLVPPKNGQRAPYDLILRQRPGPDGRVVRTGVRFLAADHANTSAAALRWLMQDLQPPDRVFLVTDERQPPALGSVGAERMEQLQQRGRTRFRHVDLLFEHYADLDALQAVVGLARTGDLEVETSPGQKRPVTAQEVVESHHRRQRYLAHPLLRELLSEVQAAPPPAPAPEGQPAAASPGGPPP